MFQCQNHWDPWGGEKRERGLEDIFEQIIAKNFPNLGNETNIRVLEAERTPPKINGNRPTPCHITVQFANLRSKETILKAVREKKEISYIQREEHQNNIRPVHRDLASQKGLARHIQGTKWEEHAPKNSLSSKTVIQNRWRDKELPGLAETERICDHQISPPRNIKGDPIKEETPQE